MRRCIRCNQEQDEQGDCVNPDCEDSVFFLDPVDESEDDEDYSDGLGYSDLGIIPDNTDDE